MEFDRVKVFSATKASDRSSLGEIVTSWLQSFLEKGGIVVDKRVTQSSDQEFHCLSVTLFLKDPTT